jgi:hypothetical protein
MHGRLENGRRAWVALCAHSSHTDTDTYFILILLLWFICN